MLPAGTEIVQDARTWAIYYNPGLNCTWLAWNVPNGVEVMQLPGHYNVSYNLGQLSSYIQSRQAYACEECRE